MRTVTVTNLHQGHLLPPFWMWRSILWRLWRFAQQTLPAPKPQNRYSTWSPPFWKQAVLFFTSFCLWRFELPQSILVHCPRSKVNNELFFFVKTTSTSSVYRNGTICRHGTLNGISPCMYIYLLFVTFRLYGNNFARTFFVQSRQSGIPVRSTEIPAKAGQFLLYKHSVPLCRDDIMLTLQIVAGKNNPGWKASRPGEHPVPPPI